MAKDEKEVVSYARPTVLPGLGEHQIMCDRMFKLEPVDRAKENLAYFSMLFFSLVGQSPNIDQNIEALKLMTDFFKIHDIPIPDPGIFIPMIKLVAKNGLDAWQKELNEVAMQIYLTTRNRVPSWKYVKTLK